MRLGFFGEPDTFLTPGGQGQRLLEYQLSEERVRFAPTMRGTGEAQAHEHRVLWFTDLGVSPPVPHISIPGFTRFVV